jgi:hypothetical protein
VEWAAIQYTILAAEITGTDKFSSKGGIALDYLINTKKTDQVLRYKAIFAHTRSNEVIFLRVMRSGRASAYKSSEPHCKATPRLSLV